MGKLDKDIYDGFELSPEQGKDLTRLKQLPVPEPEVSDIPPLTPPECKEYKRLKGKRDRGDAMSPAEMARYKELKDKIKKYKDEEEKNNQLRTPPQKVQASPEKSNMRTPDDVKMKKVVTYAPLPHEATHAESM